VKVGQLNGKIWIFNFVLIFSGLTHKPNTPPMKIPVFSPLGGRVNGLSLADAAKALGMTPRMSAYGTGKRPVPRYIALACKGWDADRNGLE
jgi:hypothetical protein